MFLPCVSSKDKGQLLVERRKKAFEFALGDCLIFALFSAESDAQLAGTFTDFIPAEFSETDRNKTTNQLDRFALQSDWHLPNVHQTAGTCDSSPPTEYQDASPSTPEKTTRSGPGKAHKALSFDNDFSYLCDADYANWLDGDRQKKTDFLEAARLILAVSTVCEPISIGERQKLLVGYSHFFSGDYYSTTAGVPFSGDADFFYTQWSVNF